MLSMKARRLESVRFCAAASSRRSLRVSRARRLVSRTILMPSFTRSRMEAICLSCLSRRSVTVITTDYHARNFGQRRLCALGVAAEDTKEVGDLAEVIEGVDGDGGIGASQEVQIEEVLPGLAAQRAGFDLHQVEIAQGEGAEGAEEGAGDIAGAEYQRCFPLRVGGGAEGMAARIIGSAQEKKAGKVLAVAFDGAAQDVGAVDFGGHRTGNRGGVGQPLFGNRLYATGRVIEGNLLELRVVGKEIQTLIYGPGMGEDASD